MSQDFTSVCDNHKEYHHLGQYMGGVASFGYGYDDQDGRDRAAEFVSDHLWCGLRIVKTDDIPKDYIDEEKRLWITNLR